MIVRGQVAVRLAGRTRTVAPTTLAEGLARLVVTGRFHHHVEREAVAEDDARRRVLAALAGRGWTVEGDVAVREEAALSARQARLSCTIRVHAHQEHARGRPGVELELVAVPLPAAPPGTNEAALKARAEHWLLDRSSCEALLARAQERVEVLLVEAEAALRDALPVESMDTEVEHGLARGWDADALAGLPLAAAAWMGALGAAADAGAWLANVAPVSADGGGWLGDGAGAGTGGGVMSSGGASGGGDLGHGHGGGHGL